MGSPARWAPLGGHARSPGSIAGGRDDCPPVKPHPLPSSSSPALTGGRRFLSDDFATFEAIAIVIARRVDAIRITNERYEREIREREIGKLVDRGRAVSCTRPNQSTFPVQRTDDDWTPDPNGATSRLSDATATDGTAAVLRSEGEFTTLGRELEVVESYHLEHQARGPKEQLQVTVDVAAGLRNIRLPPLVLQPLVENAVKHGIANKQIGGEVAIRARVVRLHNDSRQLSVVVQDTGAGTTPEGAEGGRCGDGYGTSSGVWSISKDAASLSIPGRFERRTIAGSMPVESKINKEHDLHRVAMCAAR